MSNILKRHRKETNIEFMVKMKEAHQEMVRIMYRYVDASMYNLIGAEALSVSSYLLNVLTQIWLHIDDEEPYEIQNIQLEWKRALALIWNLHHKLHILIEVQKEVKDNKLTVERLKNLINLLKDIHDYICRKIEH